MIGVFSAGIWRIPHLQNFLPSQCCKLSFLKPLPVEIEAIAVWGNRPSAQKPETVARKADIPVVRLEDGFIRSLGLGVTGSPPLSMVIDYQGIYYDARVPSTLESLIKDTQGNAVYIQQANLAISTIIEHDLSKYNQSVPFEPAISKQEKIVLVVDQTKGDVSVKFGNATEDDFQRMLSAALDENPDDAIWLKVHPDVLSGKKKGYYNTGDIHPRVRLFTGDVSPHSLFKYVKRVYAVTSHYGFEALVSGVPVVCFGQPWYSGWGLTDDRHPQAMQLAVRRGTATLVELFTSAYLRYSRYIHPQTGKPGTLFDVLSWLICQRTFIRQRAGLLWAPGLTLWKSTIVKPFLSTDKNQVSFLFRKRAASACVVWGVKGEQRWGGKATAHALPVWRLEDGFLRSSGLGSDLLPPLSLVLDKRGIYYDATRPSDLEVLLQESTLDETQRIRATRLQAFLVSNKISKYNLGDTWKLPACAASKRVILVPGQVEDDASIATGTVSINTNYDLLRLVRERNPDAFIIYKPHPDVLVGNRKGAISEHDTTRLADMQALDADIIQCIQQADELHTLTSLSGFEALMHGKKVFCYGLPFYAGWGLTIDEHRSVRRTRALTMEELVYQALIAYPTYVHPQLLQPTEVEQIGQWLSQAPRTEMKINTTRFSRVLRQFRKFKNLYRIKFG